MTSITPIYQTYLALMNEAESEQKEKVLLRLDKPLITMCIKALKMSKEEHHEAGGITKGEAKTILKRLGFSDAKVNGMKRE